MLRACADGDQYEEEPVDLGTELERQLRKALSKVMGREMRWRGGGSGGAKRSLRRVRWRGAGGWGRASERGMVSGGVGGMFRELWVGWGGMG